MAGTDTLGGKENVRNIAFLRESEEHVTTHLLLDELGEEKAFFEVLA